MTKKKLLLGTIVVFGILLGFLPAYQATLTGALAGEEVKVGLLMATSGVFEGLGGFEKKSFDLAIEEINNTGGVGGKKIKVIFYDDQGDQAKSQQLANRLIFQDKITQLFGPNLTLNAYVVGPVAEKAGIPTIVFIAQEYTVANTNYLFSSVVFQTYNAQAMVEYAAKVLKAKKVGILYVDVPYGKDGRGFLREWIKKNNLELVFEDKWGETDFDFTGQVIKAKKTKMDALFLWGSAAKADSLILKQLREGGVSVPLLGDIAYTLPGVYEIAGKALEGFIGLGWLNYGNPSPAAKKFLDGYKAKYNEVGAPLGAMCYDAAYVYKTAVERAGGKTDPVSVAKAIIGLKMEGASGSYHYTKDNHCGLTAGVYKPQIFTNGQWVMK